MPTVRSMTAVAVLVCAITFRRIAPGTRNQRLYIPHGTCRPAHTVNTLWDARLVTVFNADVHLQQASSLAAVFRRRVFDAWARNLLGRSGECDVFVADALRKEEGIALEVLNGDWSGWQPCRALHRQTSTSGRSYPFDGEILEAGLSTEWRAHAGVTPFAARGARKAQGRLPRRLRPHIDAHFMRSNVQRNRLRTAASDAG